MSETDRSIRKALAYPAAFIALFALWLAGRTQESITTLYFWQQDLVVACLGVAALVVGMWRTPSFAVPARLPAPWSLVAGAILLAACLWAGTYWVMGNYPLTRDEHMVLFDGEIFRSGSLAQPLAPIWRGYAEALVPAFLLDVPDHALLVSGYMPGNAAMRAAFSLVADPAMLNPALAGVGLVALVAVAKQLFADRPSAVWVVLAAYLLSAQVLANAMTAYAMTAHLAFNLVWLALFWRGRWWGHLGAMIIGAWAMGLHQVVFHPLFAGPFILTLLLARRWALFAAYAVTYTLGLAAWLAYPSLVVGLSGVAGGGSTGGVGDFIQSRVIALLAEPHPDWPREMAFNLFRFVAWNPLFLVPFAALGWPRLRQWRSPEWPLAVGIVATIGAMAVILPYQGHGWGYRYLHGVLGNFALLAGYGFARRSSITPALTGGTFVLLAGVTFAVTLPLQLRAAHAFTAPYVRLNGLAQGADADFVVIDTDTTGAAIDTVRNRADLANRPLRFSSRSLNAGQLAALCDSGSVALLGAREFRAADFYPELTGREGQIFAVRRASLSGKPCLRVPSARAR